MEKVSEKQQTTDDVADTPNENKMPTQDVEGNENLSDKLKVSSQIPVPTREQSPKPTKASIDEFLSRRARSSSVGRKTPLARSLTRTKRGRTEDSLSQIEKPARLEREGNSSVVEVDWFNNQELRNNSR